MTLGPSLARPGPAVVRPWSVRPTTSSRTTASWFSWMSMRRAFLTGPAKARLNPPDAIPCSCLDQGPSIACTGVQKKARNETTAMWKIFLPSWQASMWATARNTSIHVQARPPGPPTFDRVRPCKACATASRRRHTSEAPRPRKAAIAFCVVHRRRQRSISQGRRLTGCGSWQAPRPSRQGPSRPRSVA